MVSAITSQLLYMHTEQEDEWSVLSQVNYCTCILLFSYFPLYLLLFLFVLVLLL